MKVQIIGMGVVGQALAKALSNYGKHEVVGYDVRELPQDEVQLLDEYGVCVTSTCIDADAYVICVQTPQINGITMQHMEALISAIEMVNSCAPHEALISIETTMTPTMLEQCVDELRDDLLAGYSPDRYNSGEDIAKEVKLISAHSDEGMRKMHALYSRPTFDTHEVALMSACALAKLMENAQRDVNIAFMNELYNGCLMTGVDFNAAVRAAGTKSNFVPFRPGLVGGACLPKDASMLSGYLAENNAETEVLDSARVRNQRMPMQAGQRVIERLRKITGGNDARLLVLGRGYKPWSKDETGAAIFEVIKCIEVVKWITVDHHHDRTTYADDFEKYDLIVTENTVAADRIMLRVARLTTRIQCHVMGLFE